MAELGRVDGFGEDEADCESDDRAVVLCGLLTAKRDVLEALQLAHGLLDASPSSVQQLGEESGPVLCGALVRNGRTDPPRAGRLTIGPGIVALVAHSRPGCHVRADLQQHLEGPAIASLAFAQGEAKRMAVKVGLQVDLG